MSRKKLNITIQDFEDDFDPLLRQVREFGISKNRYSSLVYRHKEYYLLSFTISCHSLGRATLELEVLPYDSSFASCIDVETASPKSVFPCFPVSED